MKKRTLHRETWPSCRRGNRFVHPGFILLHEFLGPAGISQNSLARRMRVSPRRINEIVLGKRAITAETALGLADAFGPSEHYWLGLQADYDLEKARPRYWASERSHGAWDEPRDELDIPFED